MTLASTDYPFLSVMWSMFVFFGWVLFIWLLIMVYADLFRRDDIGWLGKTLWILFTIFLPFIGVFVYLIAEGRAMADRSEKQRSQLQSQMDNYVRSVATQSSPADEIERAKKLLDSGAITQDEFATLKQKALAGSTSA